MQTVIGNLVEIPDYVVNYDVDENAKNYAEWYFNKHFGWLEALCHRWQNKHPRLTWEDAMSSAWLHLPRIIKKYRNHTGVDIQHFIKNQLSWYWFADTYGVKWRKEIKNFEKLTGIRDYIEEGVIDANLMTLEVNELPKINDLMRLCSLKCRTFITMSIVLGFNYRTIAKILGIALGTVANLANNSLTEIYQKNPEFFNEYYRMHVRPNQNREITTAKQTQRSRQESALIEFNERIAAYWLTLRSEESKLCTNSNP